jgi:hypothetical protein
MNVCNFGCVRGCLTIYFDRLLRPKSDCQPCDPRYWYGKIPMGIVYSLWIWLVCG